MPTVEVVDPAVGMAFGEAVATSGAEARPLSVPPVSIQESALKDDVAETRDDGVAWALGIGALALVAGAGAIAYGGRSAPRPMADTNENQETQGTGPEPELVVAPVTESDEPEDDTHTAFMTASEVSARKAFANSASTRWQGDSTDIAARREALVARAPDAGNPFLTRRNRLRRANYLLRQENNAPLAEQGLQPKSEPVHTTAAQPEDRRMQLSYRLVGDKRPATVFSPKFT